MENWKEKFILYKKAGLPKKEILKKIQSQFGENEKLAAESILKSDELIKRKKNSLIFLIGISILLVFLLIIGTFFFFSDIQYSEFNSNKCNTSIKITGDLTNREKIYFAFTLIEENCDYLKFVTSNTKVITSDGSKIGVNLFNAGYYQPSKKKITIFPHSQTPSFIASIIIHESCHAYQDKLSTPFSEPDCALTQYNFLKSIIASTEDIDRLNSSISLFEEYKFNENNRDYFELWKQNNKTNSN